MWALFLVPIPLAMILSLLILLRHDAKNAAKRLSGQTRPGRTMGTAALCFSLVPLVGLIFAIISWQKQRQVGEKMLNRTIIALVISILSTLGSALSLFTQSGLSW